MRESRSLNGGYLEYFWLTRFNDEINYSTKAVAFAFSSALSIPWANMYLCHQTSVWWLTILLRTKLSMFPHVSRFQHLLRIRQKSTVIKWLQSGSMVCSLVITDCHSSTFSQVSKLLPVGLEIMVRKKLNVSILQVPLSYSRKRPWSPKICPIFPLSHWSSAFNECFLCDALHSWHP